MKENNVCSRNVSTYERYLLEEIHFKIIETNRRLNRLIQNNATARLTRSALYPQNQFEIEPLKSFESFESLINVSASIFELENTLFNCTMLKKGRATRQAPLMMNRFKSVGRKFGELEVSVDSDFFNEILDTDGRRKIAIRFIYNAIKM